MLLCQFPQVQNDDVSDTKPNSGFPVILCQCAHGITDISGKFNVNQGVQQSGKSQGNSRLGKSQGILLKVREKMNIGKSQGEVMEFAFSAI